MHTVTNFPRRVVDHADWGIVMPDGCRLSARIWLPEDAESDPVPAIVEHLPYRKRDGTTYRDCLTHPWFAGIANIRGNLHAVTDFSLFRGGPPIAHNANARLLLIGARHGVNAALLVSRMLGLKNPDDFTPQSADETMPAWGKARFADTHGNVWHKLSVRELLADQAFMNIGV